MVTVEFKSRNWFNSFYEFISQVWQEYITDSTIMS